MYLKGSWLLWSVCDELLLLIMKGYYGACIVGYSGAFLVGYYEANVVYGSYEQVAILGAIDDRNLTVVGCTG